MTKIDREQLALIKDLLFNVSFDTAYRLKLPLDTPKPEADTYAGYTCQCQYELQEGDQPNSYNIVWGDVYYDANGDEVIDPTDELTGVFFNEVWDNVNAFLEELAPLFGFEWQLEPRETLVDVDPCFSALLYVID